MLTAFLGGEVEVYLNSATNLVPLIRQNRTRALAITGEQRTDAIEKAQRAYEDEQSRRASSS